MHDDAAAATARPAPAADGAPDLREHGAPVRGQAQTLERRLFVQLHVFTGCLSTGSVVDAVQRSGLDAVVYADLNDPRGVGGLLMDEDPRGVRRGRPRSASSGNRSPP